ncbi:MAG: ATP-binding protein [Thiohalocapsa sp. PB-PSB1]|jgi:predicted ATPase|nr:MAG: hypothetical protein N838_31100 [Thiohalocapsa sp. PB-PSB1]QQO54494.1 MAG: ATP-binding protein [Thiohalocapsa sp. PB-PSB1]HCS90697.1 DUF2813 domain-containing protein [Chromatiaceae bacterium]
MLNRIRIQGYKSLRDVEVRLKPLSVLFGPNAAGKSNFLDALQLLSRIVSSRTLKEAFEPPYRGKPLESFTLGADGIKGLLAQESLSFSIEVDFTLSEAIVEAVNRRFLEIDRSIVANTDKTVMGAINPRFAEAQKLGNSKKTQAGAESAQGYVTKRDLRYRIVIEMLPRSGILRVADEYLAALASNGEAATDVKPFVFVEGDALRYEMGFLSGGSHRSTVFLPVDHSALVGTPGPLGPHLIAAQMELSSWLFFYFEPRERMRAANPVKEVRHIGLMGEELPAYLNTLRALEPRQFDTVEKAVSMILPQVDGIEVDVNDLGEVELRLREGGVSVPARLLSEGTLRILGMLALIGAKEAPSLVGFEEPENGIHPRRIELIAELLKTRATIGLTQYIVTTHSPILPDLMPDESLYVVRRTDAGTRIEPLAYWGPLGRRSNVEQALYDSEAHGLTVSERLLRGDFDD